MDARQIRLFESPDFEIPGLGAASRLAVEEGGVLAAAILDADGRPLAVAGAFSDAELLVVGSSAADRALSPGVLACLLAGETMTLRLDGARRAWVGMAAECLFIVAVDDREEFATRTALGTLRTDVVRLVEEARDETRGVKPAPTTPTPPYGQGGTSGSGSGPAELPLVELGITVPHRLPN